MQTTKALNCPAQVDGMAAPEETYLGALIAFLKDEPFPVMAGRVPAIHALLA
jgi:hypothetical protein